MRKSLSIVVPQVSVTQIRCQSYWLVKFAHQELHAIADLGKNLIKRKKKKRNTKRRSLKKHREIPIVLEPRQE